MHAPHPTYWQVVWKQFRRHRLGVFALIIVLLFILVGIYAPLLASSKPLVVSISRRVVFPSFSLFFLSRIFYQTLRYLL